MKRTVLLMALLLPFLGLKAQESSTSNAYMYGDLSLGAGSGVFVGALSFNRLHPILNNRLHLGYGLRINSFNGSDLTYITAPAEFTLADPPQIDTASIGSASSISLSASIHLGFEISPKLLLGFNIDVIGASFGSAQDIDINYLHSDETAKVNTTGQPTSLNVLLVGDNDLGTLNSEFYARYSLSSNFQLRGGYSLFFSEYTTELAGSDDNQRFRHKTGFPFLALSYRL